MTVRSLLMLGCMLAAAACTESPVEPGAEVVKPRCVTPAPLTGTYDSKAPGYIVVFRDGTTVSAEVNRLSARLQFAPTYVFESGLLGFAAQLSGASVAALRCDAVVAYVERNARFTYDR